MRRVPRIMATGGSMNSRGPPDHLPKGTTRSSSTTPRVQRHRSLLRRPGNDPVWNYDSTGPTPTTTSNTAGTGTQSPSTPRTQHRFQQHHCSADTKDTPEGSTETLEVHYTAGRVLPTATPPHRVLFISDPALFDYVPDNTNTFVFLNLSTRPRAHLPYASDAPRRTTTGGR